jgi:ribosome-binding ATPase YchF (GTP1/OBG family)
MIGSARHININAAIPDRPIPAAIEFVDIAGLVKGASRT